VVLRALYENLKDKSKVKLQKRISHVDHNVEGIIAICEDGTAVAGDVLVGCDGVNSKIRHELWRLSQEAQADSIITDDQKTMFAEYKCLYGIAAETAGVGSGEVHVR
jgi:2-polyprenyl-6-methoxyphenol hydroxylase-like FAD-dependent oxidoreductase